ncbi:MAG: ferritin-like domain-containing protein [Gammaproteobacteria bacterium]
MAVVGGGVFAAAWRALIEPDPDTKIALTEAAHHAWQSGSLTLESVAAPPRAVEPGRPPRLQLVHPRDLPRRGLHTAEGRCVFIHAIAHIEFNAINLALDAVTRFRDLPPEYYGDWLRVATEEAYHFRMVRDRLRDFGHDYGDFPGHDGLWDMARRTAHDVLTRMALVPRVLEARGLDVAPALIEKLLRVQDEATAGILKIILRDEIGHVAIGTHWFRYCCTLRGISAERTFHELLREYVRGELRGPFNLEARAQAGFSADELAGLSDQDGG